MLFMEDCPVSGSNGNSYFGPSAVSAPRAAAAGKCCCFDVYGKLFWEGVEGK